jgi:hypothetical protein
VFWGSNVAADTKTSMSALFGVLPTSKWAAELKSEYGGSMVILPPRTITPMVATGSNVTDDQLQMELAWQRSSGGLPRDLNYVYAIHFPPGVTNQLDPGWGYGLQYACTPNAASQAWCAYHNALLDQVGPPTYIVIPDYTQGPCAVQNCAGLAPMQGMTVAESHEIAETLTDPDTVNGFHVFAPGSACDTYEIGDLCNTAATIATTPTIVKVQTIWSNRANACVASPTGVNEAVMGSMGASDLLLTGTSTSFIPMAFLNNVTNGTYTTLDASVGGQDPNFMTYSRQQNALPVAGDFDGDGFADIALTRGVQPNGLPWTTIPLARSTGGGSFTGTNRGVTWGLDTNFTSYVQVPNVKLVAGDFDGDGRADIAAVGGLPWEGNPWFTIPVAFSNGDANGTFHGTNSGITSGDANFPYYAAAPEAEAVSGDFNCDGLSDIAILGGPLGSPWPYIRIALSNGDGTFAAINLPIDPSGPDQGFLTYATQTGAKPVAGDFDGNCFADIALTGGISPNGVPWGTIPVAHFGTGFWSFWASNLGVTSGDTRFPSDYATQHGAKPVAGDFDGDGLADIALTGGGNGGPWGTMPVAFSNGTMNTTFRGTNGGVTGGDTGFPSYAFQTLARPVSP